MNGELERPKSKETLVREAAATIYKNMITSGIAGKVVEKSAHAARFGEETYTTAEMYYDSDDEAFLGGVYVQPRLQKPQGDFVTPKLYRIFKDKSRSTEPDVNACFAAAEQIWQGVSEQQKRALFEEALGHAITKWTSEKESAVALANSDDEEDKEAGARFLKESEKQLQAVLDLQKTYREGKTKFFINWAHASLGVRAA